MTFILLIALATTTAFSIIATLCAAALATNERRLHDECERLRDSERSIALSYQQLERNFDAYRHAAKGFSRLSKSTQWMDR